MRRVPGELSETSRVAAFLASMVNLEVLILVVAEGEGLLCWFFSDRSSD